MVLAAAAPWLEPGVFVAVVDPGVGTERRALLLECRRGDLLLGPDNGLLIPAAGRLGGINAAWSLEVGGLYFEPAHPTFHGRDVFAPAAARLAGGWPAEKAGPRTDVSGLVPSPWLEEREVTGALCCQVIDVDRFGNLRLGAGAESLKGRFAAGDRVLVEIGEVDMEATVASTYGDVDRGELLLYADSSGWLGLALREDDLAARIGVKPFELVTIYSEQPE